MQNDRGLPPRAGSEYEDDLRAYGADRYAPTDLRAFAARLELITASEYEDALRACANMDDLRACAAMIELFISRLSAASTPHEHDASTKGELAPTEEKLCDMSCANFERPAPARQPPPLQSAKLRLNSLTGLPRDQLITENHIAFGAASCIQGDEDEARENELPRVRAVHFLVAQERPRAQDKDNAQYLEQENDGLRIQAGTKLGYTVAAWPGEFPEPGQPTVVTVAAAEPETEVFCEREMDTTAAAKIFVVAHQDHYISKPTAADAPTGSTLNEPESRAFTTGPRPHAFGTKNVNLTVYSRAKVKVGPLARIRIDDEVYT